MNTQEIFTKVATHLLRQNKRSSNPRQSAPTGDGYGYCAYRGAGGTSCAVGCLIEDEHYDPEIEGESAHSRAVTAALRASGIPITPEALSLLSKLQNLHDYRHPEAWPTALAELAQEFELEYTQ